MPPEDELALQASPVWAAGLDLNWKELVFVMEYMVDFNATRAYKVISPNAADTTASLNGSTYRRRRRVNEAINRALLSDRGCLDARARIVDELAAMAFHEPGDYFGLKTRTRYVGRGRGRRREEVQVVELTDTDRLTLAQKKSIKRIKQTKNGIEVDLQDKQAALVNLGKAIGLFRDRENQPPQQQLNVNVLVNAGDAVKVYQKLLEG
jgi:phage terminase small subunit